jgi:hypothetical protein
VKYMLLIYTDPTSGYGADPDVHAEYMAFTQRIIDSGEFVAGDALQGRDTATAVKVRDGSVLATDGPFAEIKEEIGGYYVVDVKDLDRAIELAAKIPAARTCGVEVRPIAGM